MRTENQDGLLRSFDDTKMVKSKVLVLCKQAPLPDH